MGAALADSRITGVVERGRHGVRHLQIVTDGNDATILTVLQNFLRAGASSRNDRQSLSKRFDDDVAKRL